MGPETMGPDLVSQKAGCSTRGGLSLEIARREGFPSREAVVEWLGVVDT